MRQGRTVLSWNVPGRTVLGRTVLGRTVLGRKLVHMEWDKCYNWCKVCLVLTIVPSEGTTEGATRQITWMTGSGPVHGMQPCVLTKWGYWWTLGNMGYTK